MATWGTLFLSWISLAINLVSPRQLTSISRLPMQPANNKTCPCENVSLCSTPTVQHPKELFGFGGQAYDWKHFDWNFITTVAWADHAEVMCEAHRSNARVIGSVGTIFSPDPAVRQMWIHNVIASVKSRFLDGVTFDFEDPMDKSPGSPTAHAQEQYVALVRETTMAMHQAIPGSQVSVCVPWSPASVDGRNYDFKALADASDLLYIMGYDTQSQIFGRCIASSNAPASRAELGAVLYMQLGISPSKLILGTPWYGYQYPCLNSGAQDDICQIRLVPFRGVNCSDAVGSEIPFMHIMNLFDHDICPPGLEAKTCQVTTPLRWDVATESPYFNFITDGRQLRQMWFDNAESSAIKYRIASKFGFRGVGPFMWDFLDGDGSQTGSPQAPAQAKSMWFALHEFRGCDDFADAATPVAVNI